MMSNISNNDDQLLSISDAASMLGVSDQTLRRWVDDGLITCIFLPSGQRRFRKMDIKNILKRGTKMNDIEAYVKKVGKGIIGGIGHDFGMEPWDGTIMPMGIRITSKDKITTDSKEYSAEGYLSFMYCDDNNIHIMDKREDNVKYYRVHPFAVSIVVDKFR